MIGFKFEFPKRNATIHVVFEKDKKQSIWDLVLKLYQDFKGASDSETEEGEETKAESAMEKVKEFTKPKPVSAKPKRVASVKKKSTPAPVTSERKVGFAQGQGDDEV